MHTQEGKRARARPSQWGRVTGGALEVGMGAELEPWDRYKKHGYRGVGWGGGGDGAFNRKLVDGLRRPPCGIVFSRQST